MTEWSDSEVEKIRQLQEEADKWRRFKRRLRCGDIQQALVEEAKRLNGRPSYWGAMAALRIEELIEKRPV